MNAGAANLTLSSVQLTGSNLFSITANNCPSSLGPGAGCQIVVTFSSKVVGQPAAQLVFTDNGSANNYYPATQQTVNLLANVVQWPFTVQLAFGIAPQAVV